MAKRTRLDDLVIVVPGLFGSRLSWNGQPLWGDDTVTFLEWVHRSGKELGRLSLGSDDPRVDDADDGVTAEGPVETPRVLGRFLRTPGYRVLLETLRKRHGLRPGQNLRFFAYDWRRDLSVAGRRLGRKASEWLAAWRSQSGRREARIVLIAHGLGGLVARNYLDLHEGWRSVRHVVCIGTHFHGTVRALEFLYAGLDFERYGLDLPDLTPVVRTLTSVYQSLPQTPSVHTFSGETVSAFDLRIPAFERQKLERSRQFHRDLEEHHLRNLDQPGYEDCESTVVAGISQPTPEQASLQTNGMLAVDRDPFSLPFDGDGSVPRASADTSWATPFRTRALYLPQTAAGLLSDPNVLGHLDAILFRLAGRPQGALRVPLPRVSLVHRRGAPIRLDADALALHLPSPFLQQGETAELRVAVRTAAGRPGDVRSARVRARAERLGPGGRTSRPVAVRLTAVRDRPGWLSGKIRLPSPGTWRLTAVSGDRTLSPFRVSDLVEVWPRKGRSHKM